MLLIIRLSKAVLLSLVFCLTIPHEFRELPGDHSWAYWDKQVQEILKIAADKMRRPPASTSKTRSLRA